MTDLERKILDFESQWWQYAGNKEHEIVRRFEMSAVSSSIHTEAQQHVG